MDHSVAAVCGFLNSNKQKLTFTPWQKKPPASNKQKQQTQICNYYQQKYAGNFDKQIRENSFCEIYAYM